MASIIDFYGTEVYREIENCINAIPAKRLWDVIEDKGKSCSDFKEIVKETNISLEEIRINRYHDELKTKMPMSLLDAALIASNNCGDNKVL